MPFESQAQRRFMYAKDPKMARRFEKKTPKNKKLPERKGKPIRKYYMNKSDGAHMMSAFDSAWSLLKSQPVSPSGKTFSPAELQELRSFVNMHAESSDPDMKNRAENILEMLTQSMSGAYGARPESEPRAPPMPFYSSTDRGYDSEREMSMGETMGYAKPVKVNKPMPRMKNQDDDEEDTEGAGIAA